MVGGICKGTSATTNCAILTSNQSGREGEQCRGYTEIERGPKFRQTGQDARCQEKVIFGGEGENFWQNKAQGLGKRRRKRIIAR